MARQSSLQTLRAKVESLKPGERITYFSSEKARRPRGVFELFRELNDAGKVFLFQVTLDNTTIYRAQRISPRAARFIKEVGNGRYA